MHSSRNASEPRGSNVGMTRQRTVLAAGHEAPWQNVSGARWNNPEAAFPRHVTRTQQDMHLPVGRWMADAVMQRSQVGIPISQQTSTQPITDCTWPALHFRLCGVRRHDGSLPCAPAHAGGHRYGYICRWRSKHHGSVWIGLGASTVLERSRGARRVILVTMSYLGRTQWRNCQGVCPFRSRRQRRRDL